MTLSDTVWERFYEQFEVWVESRNISFLKNAHCYGLNLLYLFIRPGNLNLKISQNLAALTFLRETVSIFAESKWYKTQRSTTEHVFTCELIKERTLSAEKKELVHLLLLDISTVCDSTSNKRPAAHYWSWSDSHHLSATWCGTISEMSRRDKSHFQDHHFVATRRLWVQINLNTILQKSSHHLWKNARNMSMLLVETIPTRFGWLSHRKQTLQVLLQQGLFILILSCHFKQVFVHYLKVHSQVWDNFWEVKAL